MRPEIDAALKESLVCKIYGAPSFTVQLDEREPIFQGMLMQMLTSLDDEFAGVPGSEARLRSVR